MEKAKDSYHHGDLRAALVAAAEAVLSENGVESFSLRQVARRVGVSHSAPAHHFGDAQGLLCALAAEGFRRLEMAMRARQAAAPSDDWHQVLASGLGYLDFALSAPALFRLMFGSERTRPERHTPELAEAGDACFAVLVHGIARLRGAPPDEDPAATAHVVRCWSTVHGCAELMIAGRLPGVAELDLPAREAVLRAVVSKVVDAAG
jgi:AcrR family transcriptional regulator